MEIKELRRLILRILNFYNRSKFLKSPIVVTDFNGIEKQIIIDGATGIMLNVDEEEIYDAFKSISI